MIDTPPGFLALRAPDEVPAPVRLRASGMSMAASDGDAWVLATLGVARDLGRVDGSMTPSSLRARCATLGLTPPHPAHWGAFWARLKTDGWTRGAEQTSRTATRNAAREAVWLPPELG